MTQDRRRFLQLLSAGAVASALPSSIARALALPARHRKGTLADVENIVILMQENRSFDHYFGTLRGVRGFGDPRAVNLPSGESVWNQPSGSTYVAPFRPTAPELGLQFLEDLPHGWTDTHEAWNNGKYDRWVPSKGSTTMAYLTRQDIPFHYALADAFTICDAYHCSFMGATDPNRYHMWTGWVGNDGKSGGPVLDNSEAGYDWSTYPERLQRAGVSWKIYQDQGAGLDGPNFWGWGDNPYIGNYGDNSLLYFHQYQSALPGSPLYDRARTGTNVAVSGTLFDDFRKDALADKLPQVSWIVAPESYTEHPNWPANYGAWYVSQILDALTENPEVWSKTAFFLMYDENDGFFDHMVPPTPPASRAQGLSNVDTTDEIFPGNASYASGPYGLGVRVPMLVISPWSKGGWVSSEVFDHTSLIRFIEQRFGPEYPDLIETNITHWRRAVAGDLTSAFDFRQARAGGPRGLGLPSTASYEPRDRDKHPDYNPVPPSDQAVPTQEPGTRPARAVPYELQVRSQLSDSQLQLHFGNSGKATAVFQVRAADGASGPWTYTVAPRSQLEDQWPLTKAAPAYDLSVYGPNGFVRVFRGSVPTPQRGALLVESEYRVESNGLDLVISNPSNATRSLSIWDAYNQKRTVHVLAPRHNLTRHYALAASHGWYDLTVEVEQEPGFLRQLAGHVETGHDSSSDPALGPQP